MRTKFNWGEVILIGGRKWYVTGASGNVVNFVSNEPIARVCFDSKCTNYKDAFIRQVVESHFDSFIQENPDLKWIVHSVATATEPDDGLLLGKHIRDITFGILSARTYRKLNAFMPRRFFADSWTSTPITYEDNRPLVLCVDNNGALMPAKIWQEHNVFATFACVRDRLIEYLNRQERDRNEAIEAASNLIRKYGLHPVELFGEESIRV